MSAVQGVLAALHEMETAMRRANTSDRCKSLVWVFGTDVARILHRAVGFPQDLPLGDPGTFMGRPFTVDLSVDPAYASLRQPEPDPESSFMGHIQDPLDGDKV